MSFLMTMGIGIFSVAFLPSLPSTTQFFLLLLIFCVVYGGIYTVNARDNLKANHRGSPYACRQLGNGLINSLLAHGLCFALGVGWGSHTGFQLLSHQLPDELDKQKFLVVGSVMGLVERKPERLRFTLSINSLQPFNIDTPPTSDDLPQLKKVLLSWYQPQTEQNHMANQIRAGDQWELVVRLRRPRGMLNPGGFDYQAWLREQNYSATGYVVSSDLNRPSKTNLYSLTDSVNQLISRLRAQIRDAIANSHLSELGKGVIVALTLGDKTHLAPWWEDLLGWGIIHLMVISGLHIGLVASMGFYTGLLIKRPLFLLLHWLPSGNNATKLIILMPPLLGLTSALAYSALAGFSLPTQRAVIAVSVMMIGKLFYRKLPVSLVFSWTFFLVALAQPLAVLSASFWLSFGAVAILLLWFIPWFSNTKGWRRILGSQLALLSGLALFGIGFMGHISWLAPVVNTVAVPWITMVTVPVCLLSLLSYFCLPGLTDKLWIVADWSINGLWYVLELLPAHMGLITLPIPATTNILACLFFASLAVLLPRGIANRWLLCLPLIMALIVPTNRPPLRLTVLDVGQGLAVVVELPHKLLIYDSGPAYSPTFNAGSGIVAPYIHYRGYSTIDRVLISHEDGDHAGGFYGLINSIDTEMALLGAGFLRLYNEQLYNGEQSSKIKGIVPAQLCEQSQRWSWHYWNSNRNILESIEFYVLWPEPNVSPLTTSNNSSCVLFIRWRDQQILLTGDIEKTTEKTLIERYSIESLTLLLAPHHGSKTSSSWPFISQLRPSHVVFSAGHRHHFGHPHAAVVNRYAKIGSALWNTAYDGGVTFTWESTGELKVDTARSRNWQYWWRQ